MASWMLTFEGPFRPHVCDHESCSFKFSEQKKNLLKYFGSFFRSFISKNK